MSNIHIGFVDQHRCSSRILKPPGGGYSDIFGTSEMPVQLRNSRGVAPDRTRASPVPVDNEKPSAEVAKQADGASKEDQKNNLDPKDTSEQSNGAETGDVEVKQLVESVDSLSVTKTITESYSESKEVKESEIINDGNGTHGTGTGTGTEAVQGSKGTIKDVIDGASPVLNPAATPRKRVPPGGYSSGLW